MKHGKNKQNAPSESMLSRVGSWTRGPRGSIVLLSAFTLIALAKPMGLLLWARIRILTSLPKTAIADDPTTVNKGPELVPDLDPGLPTTLEFRSDPFWIDPHIYPNPMFAVPNATILDALPKAEPIAVEDTRGLDIAAAREAAERFRLQSAGRGLSMAVIDGRMYRIGDALEGAGDMRFVLTEVLEGRVVLECDGEHFELFLNGRQGGSHGGRHDKPLRK